MTEREKIARQAADVMLVLIAVYIFSFLAMMAVNWWHIL